jgi:hypothetical protein
VVSGAFTAWLDRTYEMMERTTAAFGVDTRSPLNDRRLVELALALPDRLRWTGGLTKLVLRHAMGEALPALVRERPDKGEFSAVFAEEYSSQGHADLFRNPRLERLGWARRGAAASHLETLRQRYRCADSSYRGLIWGAYALVALEVWSRGNVGECDSVEGPEMSLGKEPQGQVLAVPKVGREKRPYVRPVLVAFGSVAKLTQGGSGSGADGGTIPGMTMPCL